MSQLIIPSGLYLSKFPLNMSLTLNTWINQDVSLYMTKNELIAAVGMWPNELCENPVIDALVSLTLKKNLK